MREIKFRAWDKTSSTMIKDYAHVGAGGELYVTQFHREAYSNDGCPDLALMQYTGVNDVYGVEIYEGDIIDSHVIEAWNSFAEGSNPGWMGVIRKNGEIYSTCQINDGKVIGNIYENKEMG